MDIINVPQIEAATIHNFKNKIWENTMHNISVLTFGIYLVNFAILRDVFAPYFEQNPLNPVELEILITFTLSFIISYIIIWAINKLPFKKYIIG